MADITVGYDADGNALDYTTLTTAYTNANQYDNLQIYYSNTNQNHIWGVVLGTIISKYVSLEGMLTTPRVTYRTSNNSFVAASGDLSSKSKITIQNIVIIGPHVYTGTGQMNLYFYNSGASADGGVDFYNVTTIGAGIGFSFTGITGVCCNCMSLFNFNYGFYVSKHTVTGNGGTNEFYFCTAIGCNEYGINIPNNSTPTVKNCISMFNGKHDITNGWGASDVDYCAVGTALGQQGGHMLTSQTSTNAQFMLQHANDYNIFDHRVHTSSDFVGQGVAIAGTTTDIDGQTRADPPTIGASEGVSSFGTGGGFNLLEGPLG